MQLFAFLLHFQNVCTFLSFTVVMFSVYTLICLYLHFVTVLTGRDRGEMSPAGCFGLFWCCGICVVLERAAKDFSGHVYPPLSHCAAGEPYTDAVG